jgi:hypothetical protein
VSVTVGLGSNGEPLSGQKVPIAFKIIPGSAMPESLPIPSESLPKYVERASAHEGCRTSRVAGEWPQPAAACSLGDGPSCDPNPVCWITGFAAGTDPGNLGVHAPHSRGTQM